MAETSPFVIQDPRFRTSRYPGFRSVPGGTGGNIVAPTLAPARSVARPVTDLGGIFANDEDRDNAANEAAGPVGVGQDVGSGSFGPSDRSVSSRDFDVVGLAESLGKGLGTVAGAMFGSGAGPVGTIGGAKVGSAAGARVGRAAAEGFGFTSPLSEKEVAELVAGPNVSTPGFSVERGSSGAADIGGGPTEAEASEPSEVGAAAMAEAEADAGSGDFGGGPSEAEASDPSEVGADAAADAEAEADAGDAGGDGGGGGAGGGDEGGDEGDDDPERAGGPVVAGRPGATVRRIAHDGEFVLQSGVTNALGEDALQLLNSGDFVPAQVRRALGLPAAQSSAFARMPGSTAGVPMGKATIPTGKSALRQPSTGLARVRA